MCKKRGEGGEGVRRERRGTTLGSRAARGSASERGASGGGGGKVMWEEGPVDAGTPGERGSAVGEGARREEERGRSVQDASPSGMSKPKIKFAW